MKLLPTLALSLGVLMSAVPAYAESPAPVDAAAEIPRMAPNAQEFTLANGMQVVVIPDHRAPVVTHMVWYKVGSADETAGQSGIAHFLEHLMFKGTATHPGDEFRRRVAAIGGDENAFTSNDYTAFFQRVAKENLAEMMAFEADRMTNLVLTDAMVATERNVVLNERRDRVEKNPDAVLNEGLLRILYLNHPYGRPVIGWNHEILALDRTTALNFYHRYYTPENAVLVVAGDVTPDEVRKLAEVDLWQDRAPARCGARATSIRTAADRPALDHGARRQGSRAANAARLRRAFGGDRSAGRSGGARSSLRDSRRRLRQPLLRQAGAWRRCSDLCRGKLSCRWPR